MKLFPLSTLVFFSILFLHGGSAALRVGGWHELSMRNLRYSQSDNPCRSISPTWHLFLTREGTESGEKKIPNEDLWQLIIIPRNVCNQTKRKRKIASKMKPAAARWMVGSSSRSLSHQIDRKRKRWRRRWRRESLSCVRHNRRLWRYLVREQCWSSELCSWMDAWIDQAVRFKKFKQH